MGGYWKASGSSVHACTVKLKINKQKESICCVIKAAVCYVWAGQHLSGSLSAFLKCNTALIH